MKGLQMTKYIVKNCPAIKPMITVDGKHGGKTMFDVCGEGKYTPCQDRTDCPLKLVVDKCKAECEAAERQLGGISEEVLQQFPQLYFLRGCRNVAYQILQMFQVEEVE